jgi:16S rRNA (cytidine1402-2'-O)-methyltransferase
VDSSRLYIVSTPIGNLGDITLRALEILRAVDVVLAEDTRHTRILCEHHRIDTPLVAFHEHNEARTIPRVLDRLARGESVALVSDAGTPLLSDPGERLVRAVWAAGFRVVPVPGASALLAALAASGLPVERFTFLGFMPRSGRERAQVLDELSEAPYTSVLYEAPSRLAATLRDLAERAQAGDREVVVARELTKRFEELRRGTASELAAYYAASPPRGEVVVVVQGRPEVPMDEMKLEERAAELRSSGLPPREVASALVRDHGVPRNLAYRLAHKA